MPQLMTPAPDANKTAADLLRSAGRVIGTAAAPVPDSPAAALIAYLRSKTLPGAGSYEQEASDYKAGFGDSVMDRYSPPGETEQEANRRLLNSPEMQRQVGQGMGVAGTIIGHASPHKWTGRPKWAAKGSGQGAATWGEAAAYASVPENFGRAVAPISKYGGLDPTLPAGMTPREIISSWDTPLQPHLEGMGITQEIVDLLKAHPDKGTDLVYREQLVLDPESVAFEFGNPARHPASTKEAVLQKLDQQNRYTALIDPKAAIADELPKLSDLVEQRKWYANNQEAFGGSHLRSIREGIAEKVAMIRALRDVKDPRVVPSGSFHVWDLPDDAKVINQFDLLEHHPDLAREAVPGWLDSAKVMGEQYRIKDAIVGNHDRVIKWLIDNGYAATKYYGEGNYSFGKNPVQNYTILNPAAIEPKGTFNTAMEFWKSPLAEDLWPQIQKEMADRLRERKLLFGPDAR